MVGRSLHEIRGRIDALSADEGPYGIICARTGERVVPVADARFGDRETASKAAELAEEYRAALRRYDPRVMVHDPIVSEMASSSFSEADDAASSAFVAFCHDVAAAVFEALSVHDHGTVEDAVMESYFDAAETVADRDELCVELLRCMARDIDEHLPPRRQARVLETAAATLSSVETAGRPVEAALARLREKSVVDAYAVETVGSSEDVRRITLEGYRLRDDRRTVPTLPLVVELLRDSDRRGPAGGVSSLSLTDGAGTASSCRVTVTLGGRDRPRGLSSVRVGNSA